MNLEDRLAQLAREAVEPMLVAYLERLEERLVAKIDDAIRELESAAVPPLLATNDLASYLGVSVRTVQRMAVAGELPQPLQVRGGSRWRQADVDAWLDTKRAEAAAS